MSTLFGAFIGRLRSSLSVLERGLIAFPFFVLGIATTTFFLGGHCSLWQFWLAFAGTLAIMCGMRFKPWKSRVIGCVLFLLFLALVWLLSGCFATSGYDNSTYHLPVTRLFMMGWNPFEITSADVLANAYGCNPQDWWPWHVMFITHPVELFNAVFGHFTQTPFNLTFSLTAFILPPIVHLIWRFLHSLDWHPLAITTMLCVFLGEFFNICLGIQCAVDAVVALAGIGVPISMVAICFGQRAWGMLIVCSIWMMIAKQSSLLTCFVFWSLFSVILLWLRRAEWKKWLLRLFGIGVLLCIVLCWVCASPYGTSWVHYGHSLYPAYTVDAERYPTVDITADFKDRNADGQAMGHIGSIVNAYISSTLAHKYYAWKLDRPDFNPYCVTWIQASSHSDGFGAPTTTLNRVIILLSFLFLLAQKRKELRLIAVFMAVGLFIFPSQYIGYLRYVPWITCIGALTGGGIVNMLLRRNKYLNGVAFGLSGCLSLYGLGVALFWFAHTIDAKWEVENVLADGNIQAFVADPSVAGENNLRLLSRQEPRLAHCVVLSPDEIKEGEARAMSIAHLFFLCAPGQQKNYSYHKETLTYPSRVKRYFRYALFVPYTWGMTLPKLLYLRVSSLF